MAEDITFKIGADTSDFNAALDKADAKVTRLSKNIKASMSTPMGQMPPGKGEEASVIPKLDMPPSLASVRAMEGPMAGIERVGGERWEDILGTPGALNKLPEPDVLERSGGRGGSDMKMLMPFLSIMFAAMAASKALQGLVAPETLHSQAGRLLPAGRGTIAVRRGGPSSFPPSSTTHRLPRP